MSEQINPNNFETLNSLRDTKDAVGGKAIDWAGIQTPAESAAVRAEVPQKDPITESVEKNIDLSRKYGAADFQIPTKQ